MRKGPTAPACAGGRDTGGKKIYRGSRIGLARGEKVIYITLIEIRSDTHRMPPRPTLTAPGIAAILGGLLRVLLAALLGGVRGGRHALAYTGVMEAAPEAEDLAYEPYVEWIAVPAPWRAGQGIRLWCRRGPSRPRHALRPVVRERGPPVPRISSTDP